jgi:hypothetical protein
VSGHLKVKGLSTECSIGLYKLVSLLAVLQAQSEIMGNLIETLLQDAILASVQGNGDMCAQSLQIICILCMYREACIYSKGSLQAALYAGSMG